MYKILYIRDHVEVYKDGEFVMSADTYQEAVNSVREIKERSESKSYERLYK